MAGDSNPFLFFVLKLSTWAIRKSIFSNSECNNGSMKRICRGFRESAGRALSTLSD